MNNLFNLSSLYNYNKINDHQSTLIRFLGLPSIIASFRTLKFSISYLTKLSFKNNRKSIFQQYLLYVCNKPSNI